MANNFKDKTLDLATRSVQAVQPITRQAVKHLIAKENPWLILGGSSLITYSVFTALIARRIASTVDSARTRDERERSALQRLLQLCQVGASGIGVVGVLLALQGGILHVETTFEWEQFQVMETRILRVVWLWLASLFVVTEGSWKDVTSARPWLGAITTLVSLGLLRRHKIGSL